MNSQFDQIEHPEWEHTCDVCFGQFPPDKIAEHMREAHGITDTEVVGYVKQEKGILTMEDATGKMVVDLEQWFTWRMFGCPDWLPNGILVNTRKDGGSDGILPEG